MWTLRYAGGEVKHKERGTTKRWLITRRRPLLRVIRTATRLGIGTTAFLFTLSGMKPSGTSLHKLAAQFVKHKRAGASLSATNGADQVCIAQTRSPRLVWRLAILGLGDVARPKPCRSPANGPALQLN